MSIFKKASAMYYAVVVAGLGGGLGGGSARRFLHSATDGNTFVCRSSPLVRSGWGQIGPDNSSQWYLRCENRMLGFSFASEGGSGGVGAGLGIVHSAPAAPSADQSRPVATG